MSAQPSYPELYFCLRALLLPPSSIPPTRSYKSYSAPTTRRLTGVHSLKLIWPRFKLMKVSLLLCVCAQYICYLSREERLCTFHCLFGEAFSVERSETLCKSSPSLQAFLETRARRCSQRSSTSRRWRRSKFSIYFLSAAFLTSYNSVPASSLCNWTDKYRKVLPHILH